MRVWLRDMQHTSKSRMIVGPPNVRLNHHASILRQTKLCRRIVMKMTTWTLTCALPIRYVSGCARALSLFESMLLYCPKCISPSLLFVDTTIACLCRYFTKHFCCNCGNRSFDSWFGISWSCRFHRRSDCIDNNFHEPPTAVSGNCSHLVWTSIDFSWAIEY